MTISHHQVVYLSRAAQRFNEESLSKLEEAAAVNNQRDGIPACSYTTEPAFCRPLKGPKWRFIGQ